MPPATFNAENQHPEAQFGAKAELLDVDFGWPGMLRAARRHDTGVSCLSTSVPAPLSRSPAVVAPAAIITPCLRTSTGFSSRRTGHGRNQEKDALSHVNSAAI